MHKTHPFHVGTGPLLLLLGGIGAVISIARVLSTETFLKHTLRSSLGADSGWKALTVIATLFALANAKNLPFAWHYRFLRSFWYQLWRQPYTQTPKHLFDPLVISSRNTIFDCDYNIHKSNSTYFTDLDIALAHAVGIMLRTGLERLNRNDQQGVPAEVAHFPGKYNLALGGVSCFFHKQIEPLQAYDICTRLLTWDHKWIYFVSHFVRKGIIQPESYVLQPWKRAKTATSGKSEQGKDLRPHIFATSIARYVGKKGRLTMSPEVLLEYSRLLAPRTPSRQAVQTTDTSTQGTSAKSNATVSTDAKVAEVGDRTDGWKWDDMEKERLRGLELARHFDALGSGLQSELSTREVLGRFGTYW